MSDFFTRPDGNAADTPVSPPAPDVDPDIFGALAEDTKPDPAIVDASGKPKRVPIERLHKALNQKSKAEDALTDVQKQLATARETLAKAEGRLTATDSLERTVSMFGERYAGADGADLLDYDSQFIGGLQRDLDAGKLPDAVREVIGRIHKEIAANKGEKNVTTKTLLPKDDSLAKKDSAPVADARVDALLRREVARSVTDAIPGLRAPYAKMATVALLASEAAPTDPAEVREFVGKFLKAEGFTGEDVLAKKDPATKSAAKKPNLSGKANTSVPESGDDGDGDDPANSDDPARPKYKTIRDIEAARTKRTREFLQSR